MKTYWGRMQILHRQAHPRHPRLPHKDTYTRAQNPYAYLLKGNSALSLSARRIVYMLKKHNLATLDWDTRGVVYAAFQSYPHSLGYNWVYV